MPLKSAGTLTLATPVVVVRVTLPTTVPWAYTVTVSPSLAPVPAKDTVTSTLDREAGPTSAGTFTEAGALALANTSKLSVLLSLPSDTLKVTVAEPVCAVLTVRCSSAALTSAALPLMTRLPAPSLVTLAAPASLMFSVAADFTVTVRLSDPSGSDTDKPAAANSMAVSAWPSTDAGALMVGAVLGTLTNNTAEALALLASVAVRVMLPLPEVAGT